LRRSPGVVFGPATTTMRLSYEHFSKSSLVCAEALADKQGPWARGVLIC
jgi:hypothetical protein